MLTSCGLCALSGCGGGGGGSGTPAQTTTRLAVADIEFAAAATTADLTVSLAELPAPAPVLLQVAIELPTALVIAPGDSLQPAQAMPTLQGQATGNRFVVICGDDQTAAGQPLIGGQLFRLQLALTTPRQPGVHTVRVTELLAARSDGSPAAATTTPTIANVTVR